MTKLIHTMIRVRDLDRSVRFYREALELAVRDHFPFDGFSLTYLANDQSGFELELTHNQGQAEPYSHGNGYGHLAVTVADIEAAHQRLTAQGLAPAPVKAMHHEGTLLARLFFLTDPDGYQIEFIERAGRFA
ncbi:MULTISPECIES: VOC family protein [Aeromonas]|uniref:VOC family protein n=1 Tax=Aeromonas TaxID=642 RepID=UPI001C5A65B2|nr:MULTISPECIES: VOC family protein [Aeromonas]MBW3832926.1 lactoylglutathione lyase [Aeromonas hydrophila]MBW5265366.1 lactoylglutathione lyase [Aeromonas hydrophila]MBW5277949.1 lactoylglutathione lyase [Aeromonas hydrophila]